MDKIRVAEKLDEFGVHYIEGGFPGSNPKDAEFFREAAKRTWKHAKIAAFGATRRGKHEGRGRPAGAACCSMRRRRRYASSARRGRCM